MQYYYNGRLIHFLIETVTSFELQQGQKTSLSHMPDAHGPLRRASCPFEDVHAHSNHSLEWRRISQIRSMYRFVIWP